MTTVWAWLKTVVMVKQPGHLTSMKNERGEGTRVCVGGLSVTASLELGGAIVAKNLFSHLELVFACLGRRRRIEEVGCENLDSDAGQRCPR